MSDDTAPPTEPVIQDFILLSSASEALYLTCKNGLLMLEPKTWSYTDEVPAGTKTPLMSENNPLVDLLFKYFQSVL